MAFGPVPSCARATDCPVLVTSKTVMILLAMAEVVVSVIASVVAICVVTTVEKIDTVEPSFWTPPAVSVYSPCFAQVWVCVSAMEWVADDPSAVAMFLVAQQTTTTLPTVRLADGLTASVVSLTVSTAEPRAVMAEKAIYAAYSSFTCT